MTQGERDMVILAELAEEISQYGVPGLPGSLRASIKTQRARKVAEVLEQKAWEWARLDMKRSLRIEELEKEVNGLRDEMQVLTDSTLQKL